MSKILESSFIWPRDNGYYNAAGPVDILEGYILYCYQAGRVEEFFPERSEIVYDYARENDMGDCIIEDKEVKKIKSAYKDSYKGLVYVESRSKRKEIKHTVEFRDIVNKNTLAERKELSFKNMWFRCSCEGSVRQRGLATPYKVREGFEDYRPGDAIIPPTVESVVCTHAAAAMNLLVEEHDCEGFEMFGLNNRVLKFVKYLLDPTLGKTYPKYKLNRFLRDETTLFDPWKERLDVI